MAIVLRAGRPDASVARMCSSKRSRSESVSACAMASSKVGASGVGAILFYTSQSLVGNGSGTSTSAR